MNRNAIINKYKNKAKQDHRGQLRDGRVVVGEEVDENNYLYYVVANGNDFAVERAENAPLASFTIITNPQVHHN